MIIATSLAVRSFNEKGVDKFLYLMRNRGPDLFLELERLTVNPAFTQDLGVELEWKQVTTRLEMAEVMWELFGSGKSLESRSGDPLIWNWLSAALFETLVRGDGTYVQKKKNEEIERWVLTKSSRSYHRHLVSGPFFVFQNNWPNVQNAMCMLAESHRPIKGVPPVLIFSEVHERITGKRELAYGQLAHLATLLYVDPKTMKIRDNLTDKLGEPQQLSTFCRQLDLTVDYESMTVRELLDFLPKNFSGLVSKVKSENPQYR